MLLALQMWSMPSCSTQWGQKDSEVGYEFLLYIANLAKPNCEIFRPGIHRNSKVSSRISPLM